EGDYVLEAVRFRPPDEVAHTARFQLKYGGRVAGREELIGRRVVERDARQRKIGMAHFSHRALGPVEDGEGREAEEVELDQADRLDVVLVELRNDVVGAFGGIKRAVVDEATGRDQHAAGMHADVAYQALELLAELEELLHF